MAAQPKWLPLFLRFIRDLRIDSKEVATERDGKGSKLTLWRSQRMFLEDVSSGLEEGIHVFINLKSRQLGISTISLAIDIFWLAMHPGMLGALVADNDTNSAYFRKVLTRYIASFPPGFFGSEFRLTANNKNGLQFSNGSRLDLLVAGKSKKAWSESRGYTLAHATEVAKYGTVEGLASFRESLAQAHPDRLFMYESTAAGFNHWKDMWDNAGKDTLSQRRFFIGWWAGDLNRIGTRDRRYAAYGLEPPDQRERELIALVKERHGVAVTQEMLAWHRWREADESADPNQLEQNQPWISEHAFIMSGYSFFQTRVIQQEMQRVFDTEDGLYKGYKCLLGNDFFATKMQPIEDSARVGEVDLRIWEEPIVGARYVIGCDPAYGRTDWGDRHAIIVCRCFADRLVQVAEYASNEVEARQATWVLAYLAGAYRDCVVNVELGGPGRAVMSEFNYLREQLRAEIYNDRVTALGWEDFMNTARWYLYHKPDSPGAGYVYNFETNSRTKWEVMFQLRDTMMMRQLQINSVHALEEMGSIIQDGNEISAPPGKNNKDDRVFALALCNRAWIDHVRSPMLAEGLTYDKVMGEELGTASRASKVVDRIVYDWFRRQEEAADEPEVPVWMRQRGLA